MERDELQAWVDGRLEGSRLQRVERLLDVDPQARAEAQALRRQAEALKSIGKDVLVEPVPQRLLQAASGKAVSVAPAHAGEDGTTESLRIQRPAKTNSTRPGRPDVHKGWPAPRRPWLAAAVLAFAAWSTGWLSHAWFSAESPIASARGTKPPRFVQDAVAAHVVYTPEVRHPVEVAAAQHEHLVHWLSKRLGAPLAVPSLDAFGWSLVGGRLLPGTDGARAQFMYQDPSGARLTLYVANAGEKSGDTAFRFDRDGRVAAFYWIDGRFGYALSAETSRESLLALAEEVYRQLDRQRPGERTLN